VEPIGRTKEGTPTLRVHIQPRAAKNRVGGLHGNALKLAVTAPPVDGKANKVVAIYLAELFQVSRKNVLLLSGRQSRSKVFGFVSLTQDELQTRLLRLLPGPWTAL
jgi:uncharacterized protein (TIGR00251 family)